MRERGVAALVISGNARTRHLTGYQRYFTATHAPPVHDVVLTHRGSPYLLVPRHVGLEAGMVFALEPGVYAPGTGCSPPEDMILATAAGTELLTHFPRDHDRNRDGA